MELLLKYVRSDDLVNDSRAIIEAARHQAYMAVNTAMVERNWLLGKRIAEEELKGKDRATYGGEIIKGLARELTALYGKGFTKTENPYCSLGHTTALCCKWTMTRHANGMPARRQKRCGACVRCSGTFLRNIISASCSRNTKTWWKKK